MSAGRVLAARYELIELLGEGGMGSVWRARSLAYAAEVAVKLIAPELMASKEALSRFRREAEAAAAIRSTHVVQILDYGVDDKTPYLVMELLKGESLARRLEQVQRLAPEHTSTILGQVARALAMAHRLGIVHRDLKPDNLFLVREEDDEIAKVLDFGIARNRSGVGKSSGVRTQTGALLGTPFYMSPEQATAQEVDTLTDIWAFGIIAFECLTGRRPFDGESFLEVGNAICKAPMPVPSEVGGVPAGFDEWFAHAAARQRNERFQSIKAAADALRTVCGRASARPSTSSIPERGGTVVSAGASAPAPSGRYTSAGNSQVTVGPSSRSLAGVPAPARHVKLTVALGALAVGLAGTVFGVHALKSAGTAAASAPLAELPTSERVTVTSPAPSAPPKNSGAPSPSVIQAASPIALSPADAGIAEASANESRPHRQAPANPGRPKPAPATSNAPTHSASTPPFKPASPNPFGGID